MSLLAQVFPKLLTPKELVLKRLKGLASEHISGTNEFSGSKHCWNNDGTSISLFLHEYEVNWVGKSLSYSDMKSQDIFLTYWLPMISIPVAACRISCNNFKGYYVKNKSCSLNFFLSFWNLHQIYKIVKKNESRSFSILEVIDLERRTAPLLTCFSMNMR